MSEHDVGQDEKDRDSFEVPVAWEALEDAFENNAPEVHSYLHFDTGEVIRVVDGVADPSMHARIMSDSRYLRIDPVSSREQYRWMERFIATVEEPELRRRLNISIDGKGAFRRFKDALVGHPIDRERWFAFRSERLRSCMESWLTAHGIHSVERPTWHVPTAEEVEPEIERQIERQADPLLAQRRSPPAGDEVHRRRLHELVDRLAPRDLEKAGSFLEFLAVRHPSSMPGPESKAGTPAEVSAEASETE